MSEETWNGDRFGLKLTAQLTQALAPVRDGASLATVVAACADAAEAPCRGRQMACGAGCPYCCVLNVAILLPEALVIARSLRERLPARELAETVAALATHRSWARWMDDEERIIKHMSCPFLDNAGSCSIHPVRPLACRGVTSLDSAICREVFAPAVTDEMRLVPTDLLRKDAYDEAFTALAAALTCNGFDDRSIELGAGVHTFLEHPEYEELFLKREKLPEGPWR